MNRDRNLRQARYARACWWLAQGVDIVPLKPQSKELQFGYGARQAHITNADFARQWFLNTEANLGVVLGGSAGLVVADWDAVTPYDAWRSRVGTLAEALTEQSARGYHVFFASPGLRTNFSRNCELKATGVCMVAPSVHPTGTVYRVVINAPIAQLDPESAPVLFPFLSEMPPKEDHWHRVRAAAVNALRKRQSAVPASGPVITRIKTVRSILDEMLAAGVKLQPIGRTTWVGLCPFHPDHAPSLWANPQSGLWGCNRPDCPAAGTHDVINFRAMRCGISNEAAIRQLASEFLTRREDLAGRH
jgi:hypothetical protein